jgi:(S)-3,5-dihydroxyphenylglycine transaminase
MPAVAAEPGVLRIDPDQSFQSSTLESMNFLNEAVGRFPDAISFAAGRPPDHLLGTERVETWLRRFVEHTGSQPGASLAAAWQRVGQYSDTGGIIRDLVARYMAVEGEGDVDAAGCIITNGFQEALLLHLVRLARRGGAVVALDPTYVGLTGAAMAAGVPVYAAPAGRDPIASLAAGARVARAAGHAEICAYVIADHDNPSGRLLDGQQRREVVALAQQLDMTVLEDAAYRWFHYDGPRPPSLLSLDREGRVVYLGTFSKMFLPGVRVGFSASRRGAGSAVADSLALKSFISVATSPVAQAIVGGFLLDVEFRVGRWNAPRVEHCRRNRDAMLSALADAFAKTPEIRWTTPSGGFFIVVHLPFRFAATDSAEAARRFGVLVTPMGFFSPSGGCQDQARLAFSNGSPQSIGDGVARFAAYVRDRMGRSA